MKEKYKVDFYYLRGPFGASKVLLTWDKHKTVSRKNLKVSEEVTRMGL